MTRNWPIFLKSWQRGVVRDSKQFFEKRTSRHCPCCEYQGTFVSAKKGGSREFRCPNCESRPRDRQIALILREQGVEFGENKILHIAPEWPLFRRLNGRENYVGGDIIRRRNSNAYVDITDIQFDDGHFDILLCNHVLEHVPDDALAMRECSRVMAEGGKAIFSVPIAMDQEETWEPPADMPEKEVEKICGWDHKRLYGRDFKNKLENVGFSVEELVYHEDIREKHRLFEEPIYLATKVKNRP